MWRGLSLALGLSLASNSFAFMDDYLPLAKSALQPTVALTVLKVEENATQLTPEIKIAHPSEQIMMLSGVDKAGKPWSFSTANPTMFTAYQADLDQNGQQDIVISYPTMATGSAPSTHLITLAFDETGRPVVSEIEGYFEENDKGIVDLVDTNKNGKAELVYMMDSDGYWVTSLYELQNARWQTLAQSGDHQYPLYTRYTKQANHKSTKPDAKHHPFATDLSNQNAGLTGTLSTLKWANISQYEDITLDIQSAKGNHACTPSTSLGTFTIVLDSPQARKIVNLSAGETAVKDILTEIQTKAYPVSIYGQRDAGKCNPELLWAVSK
ncbi:hypothetical protein [Thiolinea disciformis]|uniref:hypothetical protein n=1 Tax=Thiolinea disciformis TaxID=125614 RepID=UPI000360CFEF|nr:hypothetical protein [Thiolinea disciformis]